MGASVRPDSVPVPDRITRNVAALKSQGASDDDIHAYLTQHEGLKPAPAPQGAGMLGAAESLTQGVLGGFADEIGGAGAAALDAAGDILHGRPTHFGQDYVMYRDTARQLQSDFAKAHPVGNVALQTVGGAVPAALTGGAVDAALGTKMATTLGRRALSSAVTGGVTSGIFGAGNATGSVGNRVAAGAESVPLGAAFGAAVPVVSKAIGATPNAIRTLARSTAGIGTKDEALRQLGEIVAQSGKSPDAIAASAAANKAAGAPVMLADELGENGRKLIRWTVNQPSEGGADLTQSLENRQIGQYDRIVKGVSSAFGQDPANVPQTTEALLAQRRANAAPLYAAAHADPPFASPTLDAAMKSPWFRKAIEKGHELAYAQDVNDAIQSGKQIPVRTPAPTEASAPWQEEAIRRQFADDPQMLNIALNQFRAQNPGGGSSGIPVRTLDYAKRYLDNGIRRGFDAQSTFDHTSASATNSLLGQVLDELDVARPNFAKARAVYHSDSKMLEAVDLGQKALTMAPDELAAITGKMSPAEKGVAQATFLSAFKNAAGNVADRNDLSKRFLADPNMRARFELMAPDANAMDATQALAGREGAMARSYNAATGNSTTAGQQMMNDAINGGVTPADLAVLPLSPHRTIVRLAGRVGQQLRNQSNIKLSNELAPLLGAEPGTQTFDDVIQALRARNTLPNTGVPTNRSLVRNALLQSLTARTGSGQRQP